MPPVNVRSVLRDLINQVQQNNALLAAARGRGTPFFQLQQIAELSFLRIFLAWENFLEKSFTRYLCGARAVSGFRPKSYAKPKNIDHALDLLTIGATREPPYVDWTNAQTVIRRAQLVFKNGRPFVTPLQAGLRDLDDMRIIRDCVAHRSSHAQNRFNKVVQHRLGVAHICRPGGFLLRRTAGSNQTFLDFFSQQILLVAQEIVH